MGCSQSKVAPLSLTPALSARYTSSACVVLWDTENLSGPLKRFTMGDLSAALAQCSSEASSGAPSTVVAVHSDRFPRSMRSSLRVRGATLLDAGPKRGSVDGALKGYWNDVVVDALLRAPGVGARGWLWVASGDKDFSDDVRRAQRAGFKVGIVFGEPTAADFLTLGDARVPWRQVVAAAERIAEEMLRRGMLEAPCGVDTPVVNAVAPPAPVATPRATPQSTPRAKSTVPCRDFQRKACFRANCRFAHVKVGSNAVAEGGEGGGAAASALEEAGGLPASPNSVGGEVAAAEGPLTEWQAARPPASVAVR